MEDMFTLQKSMFLRLFILMYVLGFPPLLMAQDDIEAAVSQAETSILDFLESTQEDPKNDISRKAEHLQKSFEKVSEYLPKSQTSELRLNVGRFADSIEQDRYFDAIDLALDGKTLLLAFINEPRVHSRVLVMEIEGLRLTKFLEHPKFPTERFESTVNRIAEHWNVVEGQVKVVQLSGAISETIAALKESTTVDNPSLRERSINIFYYLSKLLPIYWERNHTE